MRRSILIFTMVAVMLALSAGAALAAVIQCQGGFCDGTPNPDTMTGTNGEDRMHGGGGGDVMRAREGSDVLSGDSGNDTLDGGTGNDDYAFDAGWGVDTISDSEGYDALYFGQMKSSVTVDLKSSNVVKAYSGTNKVRWSSPVVIENVWGGQGADIIKGGDTDSYLLRRGGDEKIWGNGGSDGIWGEEGNDTIFAQWDGGADRIYCGPGYDTVHYDKYADTFLDSESCEEKRPYFQGTFNP